MSKGGRAGATLVLMVLSSASCGRQLVEFSASSTDPDFAPAAPADLAMPDAPLSPDMYSSCTAVLFDGVYSIVTAPAQSYLNPGDSMTVEAWVWPGSLPMSQSVVVGHWGNPSSGTGSYLLALDSTNRPTFQFSATGSDTTTVVANDAIPLFQWTHLAGQFDRSTHTLTLYVGGVLGGQDTVLTLLQAFPTTGIPLHIGRFSSASAIEAPLSGYIDEVRISSVARYSATFTPDKVLATDSNTIAMYHFDETSGATAADSSANHNTAQLQQNAMFASPAMCF